MMCLEFLVREEAATPILSCFRKYTLNKNIVTNFSPSIRKHLIIKLQKEVIRPSSPHWLPREQSYSILYISLHSCNLFSFMPINSILIPPATCLYKVVIYREQLVFQHVLGSGRELKRTRIVESRIRKLDKAFRVRTEPATLELWREQG